MGFKVNKLSMEFDMFVFIRWIIPFPEASLENQIN